MNSVMFVGLHIRGYCVCTLLGYVTRVKVRLKSYNFVPLLVKVEIHVLYYLFKKYFAIK